MKLWIKISVILQVFYGANSFIVNCIFTQRSVNGILGSTYNCEITNIGMQSNHTVTGITGNHLSGKSNNDVQLIFINGNRTLSFIPLGFSEIFPNIKGYRIHNSDIKVLTGNELEEFEEKFEYFSFYSSSLTTVSSRLFETTPNVNLVYLYNNIIERVGYHLFTPLNITKLREVDFSYNQCINRFSDNQTAIQALINDLQVLCPFDDEDLSTLTTSSTEFSTLSTTSIPETCFEDTVEEFVCELKKTVDEVQSDLIIKGEKLDETSGELSLIREELELKDQTIIQLQNDFSSTKADYEARLNWLEYEVLRLTTNPCSCK